MRDDHITRYRVTQFYRQQIERSGYYEQLKHIVEPSLQEFQSPGSLDPSGEHDHTVMHGFRHKYAQTGLLLVMDGGESDGRYSFRKRPAGKKTGEIAPDYAAVTEYIRQHPEINNVLLTGGDPFILHTAGLNAIVDQLLPLPNLTSLRFATKMIAFYPPRFADPELPRLFERIRVAGKTPVIVSHFDHVGEISTEAERNILALRSDGVQFLNRTVLLGRVNDDPDVLVKTFERCHSLGVRPYYLFQARPVKGAPHFQVPLKRALQIVQGVNARLSGIQKTFKYIMSHYTGKIEILDLGDDDRLYMRYHQSPNPDKVGRIFSRPYRDGACWLDDLPEP